MKNLEEIFDGVKTAAVLGHVNPDGDCVGSTTAMYLYIRRYHPDIDVRLFLDGFKPEFDLITVLSETVHEDDLSYAPDVAILLDTSSYDRIGTAPEITKRAAKTVCIDHHISNEGFCDVNHIVPDASSASEVLFDLMDYEKITKDIAISLYTGIIHDSGVFQYKNTSAHTLEVAAKLVALDIPFNMIIEDSFYSRTFKESRIIGRALDEAVLYFDGKCIYSEVTTETMNAYSVTPKDLSVIVSQLRLVRGVEVAVFLYPGVKGGVKVSLRSNDNFDVSKLAAKFDGGGHVKAAGCTIFDNFENAKNAVLHEIEKSF